MTIRISLGILVVALVFAAVGAGTAVGVMVWEPWDGNDGGDRAGVEPSPASASTPAPTPYQRRLTGAEAAAVVGQSLQGNFSSELTDQLQQAPPAEVIVIRRVEECEATDFNERLLAWIVECQISTDIRGTNIVEEPPDVHSQTYRLYDATGRIAEVVP